MKILCVADHIDPLVYSNQIKSRFKEIEIILGAGDLPLDYYEYIISCLNKPLYFVFGNHNLKRYHLFRPNRTDSATQIDLNGNIYDNAFGSQYIGSRIFYIRKKDLIIGGLGGSFRYNKGPNQYSELGMFFQAFRLIPQMILNRIFRGRFIDILLTHAPPKGIGDKEDRCHRGFSTFLWFMKYFKPKYLIHGHIHLYDNNAKRKSLYMETTIVNCYDHLIIDWEKAGKENE